MKENKKKCLNARILFRNSAWLLIPLIPVLALCLTEGYTHVPWDLSVPVFFLNLAGYIGIYLLGTFVFGSVAGGYTFATLFFMCCGFANYCVVCFRSSPIVPWDLYSLRTAVSVADNYHLDVNGRLLGLLAGFLLLTAAGRVLNLKIKRLPVRLCGMLLSILCLFGYIKAMGNDTVIQKAGLDTTLFTPNVLYRNNGLVGGFTGTIRYMRVEKPDGYSEENAMEIAKKYDSLEQKETGAESDMAKYPNIIVIMNEAFSDLSVFGEFAVSEEYMPFIRSLNENTIKGNAYVSVKGGNTANSEYEFLTGDSMAFMPAGSVPYQQYIKSEMPSLASSLRNLGYQTTAIHPYYGSGWSRDKVYPFLGFEQTIFRDGFSSPKKMRNYISDTSAFEKIIELYEEKNAEDRLFVFEVTMQNHGGYSKDTDDFSETIFLTDESSKTIQVRAVEKYLTLISESDRAFEQLAAYFKEAEEPTIILMFGDHQPSDYITNVIFRELGLDRETSVDAYYKNYCVPYVMWANYKIDSEGAEEISLNYLGGMLMEKAGIELTGYQKFLKEMQKELPVITANMVMDQDGNRTAAEEVQSEWIEAYQELVYNHLCDKSETMIGFFE